MANAFTETLQAFARWEGNAGGQPHPLNDPDDRRFERWSRYRTSAECALEGTSPDQVRAIRERLGSVNDTDLAVADRELAKAWALDTKFWTSFPRLWQVELGSPESHELKSGEIYPVGDWLPHPPDSLDFTARPSAQASGGAMPPHLRRWEEDFDFVSDIVFDFSISSEVRQAAECWTSATLHPLTSDAELDGLDTLNLFPVMPSAAVPSSRVAALLGLVPVDSVGLVVGSELSLSGRHLASVQEAFDGALSSPPLVVPGSQHVERNGAQYNEAPVLRYRDCPHVARKLVAFDTLQAEDQTYKREAISTGETEFRVFVGDWARFAVVICKDLLVPEVRRLLQTLSINLLAVPTCSDEMSPFVSYCGSLVVETQGRVVIANSPFEFDSEPVWPAAVVGQPLQGRESRSTSPPATRQAARPATAVHKLDDTLWIELH